MATGTYVINFDGIEKVKGLATNTSNTYIFGGNYIKLTGVTTSGSVPSEASPTSAILQFNSMKVWTTYWITFDLRAGNNSTELWTVKTDDTSRNKLKQRYNTNSSTGTLKQPLSFSVYNDNEGTYVNFNNSLLNIQDNVLYVHFRSLNSENGSGTGANGNMFTNNTTSGSITVTYTYSSGGGGGGSATSATISSVTSSVNLGGTSTVSITNTSSNLSYEVKWTFGARTYSTRSSPWTFTIPTAWGDQMSTLNSDTAYVSVTTYDGDTQVGNASIASFTIVNTSNPSCGSISMSRGGTTKFGNDKYVQGLSTVTLSITATPSYGASVSQYMFECGSEKQITSTGQATFTVPGPSGSTSNNSYAVPVKCTITDSRGLTDSTTDSFTAYLYSSPTLSSCRAIRTNNQGVADENGTYFKITGSANMSSVNGSNTAKLKVFYQENGAGDNWIQVGDVITLNNQSQLPYAYNYGPPDNTSISIKADKEYNIKFEISDEGNENNPTRITISLTTSGYIMFFREGGTAVGIGTTVSNDSRFVVSGDWDMYHGSIRIPDFKIVNTLPTSGEDNTIYFKKVT